MATQHPDNAGPAWWHADPFVSTQDEIDEVIALFGDVPIDEYMWDWEGKYVDEAVGEKLYARAGDFFRRHPLGKDLRLTYRIPAVDGGKMHRMARAMMNVLALADLGRDLGLPYPPVSEMFLPLTTSSAQPIAVRRAFQEIAEYHSAVFHRSRRPDHQILDRFEVTPLVEDVDSLLAIDRIVRPYWRSLQRQRSVTDQRIFMARSDPAMNSGLVPAVLAIKAALSTVQKVGDDMGLRIHPIIGTGSLPFRGSVNPTYTEAFLRQYAGVRTYTIQSAFRSDYPKKDVIRALKEIRSTVPRLTTLHVPSADLRRIRQLCTLFTTLWKPTIEAIAPEINAVAEHLPRRRERLQHIGLFGYSRGVGKVRLPRAIGFTGALYSLGVPPEFIATGRGLLQAKEEGLLDMIHTYYPALIDDLRHAGKYVNRDNIALLARRSPAFRAIERDIAATEDVLGIAVGPEKPRHEIHRCLTSLIYHRLHTGEHQGDTLQRTIVEAATIRRSIG